MTSRTSESLRPFRSVRDVLRAVIDLHVRAQRRYAAAARCTTDGRAAAMLCFLADREAEQVVGLARLCGYDDPALDCYVQSVPAQEFDAAVRPPRTRDGFATIAASWMRRERALETCFRQLGETVGPRARRTLDALLQLKRTNQERLQQAMLDG